MAQKIAVKMLTDSDLTVFEALHKRLSKGNQKSINLNADVFQDQFFPALKDNPQAGEDGIPVTLDIFGPGGASIYAITRAIRKGAAYKNWRLNGEFIRDPQGEPGRFDKLTAGDLAIMSFEGNPPAKIRMLLLSKAFEEDLEAQSVLARGLGARKSMSMISPEQLAEASLHCGPDHPIHAFAGVPANEAALEEAALGGVSGIEVLTRRSRPTSRAELARAKATVDQIGRTGEELVSLFLEQEVAAGRLKRADWVSDVDAVSPFDFEVEQTDGTVIKIDVKTTNGDFRRNLHVSLGELRLAQLGEPYEIWRIHSIEGRQAKLRRSCDFPSFARAILSSLTLPPGVFVDSFSVVPDLIRWHPEADLYFPD